MSSCAASCLVFGLGCQRSRQRFVLYEQMFQAFLFGVEAAGTVEAVHGSTQRRVYLLQVRRHRVRGVQVDQGCAWGGHGSRA